jgi:hypothetical protein
MFMILFFLRLRRCPKFLNAYPSPEKVAATPSGTSSAYSNTLFVCRLRENLRFHLIKCGGNLSLSGVYARKANDVLSDSLASAGWNLLLSKYPNRSERPVDNKENFLQTLLSRPVRERQRSCSLLLLIGGGSTCV